MPEEVASKLENSISVENLELEQYDREGAEEDSVDFNHSFTLLFRDKEGNDVEETELNGQMTVLDTEDGLRISRYHDNKKLIKMLYP